MVNAGTVQVLKTLLDNGSAFNILMFQKIFAITCAGDPAQ